MAAWGPVVGVGHIQSFQPASAAVPDRRGSPLLLTDGANDYVLKSCGTGTYIGALKHKSHRVKPPSNMGLSTQMKRILLLQQQEHEMGTRVSRARRCVVAAGHHTLSLNRQGNIIRAPPPGAIGSRSQNSPPSRRRPDARRGAAWGQKSAPRAVTVTLSKQPLLPR